MNRRDRQLRESATSFPHSRPAGGSNAPPIKHEEEVMRVLQWLSYHRWSSLLLTVMTWWCTGEQIPAQLWSGSDLFTGHVGALLWLMNNIVSCVIVVGVCSAPSTHVVE